jgi:hypothetical protein
MSSSRDHAHSATDGQGNPVLADINAALLEALKKAREYVADHWDAQPNQETGSDLTMIDAAIAKAEGSGEVRP